MILVNDVGVLPIAYCNCHVTVRALAISNDCSLKLTDKAEILSVLAN